MLHNLFALCVQRVPICLVCLIPPTNNHDCGPAEQQLSQLAERTELYSASDLKALCHEAAMGPIREQGSNLASVSEARLRPVKLQDFGAALKVVRATVTAEQVREVRSWAQGSGSAG